MKKYFIYPGGNPTVLVDNREAEIPCNEYIGYSKDILQSVEKCEQVGFIEKGDNTEYGCQMMGGEFCINALRSLGFCLYMESGLCDMVLESSGTNDLFEIKIEQWVSINFPKKYRLFPLEKNLDLVELDGISHFVQEIESDDWNEKKYGKIFSKIRYKYSSIIASCKAIGLMLVDENNKLYPFVFVRATNSLILESACGSGTIAAFLAQEKLRSCFYQPSGFPYLVEETNNGYTLKSAVNMIELIN